MIKYFNTGYLSRYILVLLIGIIIWIPTFIFPDNYLSVGSSSFNLSVISEINSLVTTIVSFFLVVVTAFLLNRYSTESGIVGKISTMVFFVYILISGALTDGLSNNSLLIVNFFFVFVWSGLMKLPYTNNTIPLVFNVSFIVGIASLFYTPLVYMFLLIWMAIFIHRIVTWRNLFITIIGVALPYLFLYTWLFYSENVSSELNPLFTIIPDLSIHYPSEYGNLLILVLLIIISLFSVFGTLGSLNENSINRRRNLLITVVFFLLALIIYILFSGSVVSLQLMTIPFVLIISYWFSHINNHRWYNFSLVFLMLAIVLNQYSNLIFKILEL